MCQRLCRKFQSSLAAESNGTRAGSEGVVRTKLFTCTGLPKTTLGFDESLELMELKKSKQKTLLYSCITATAENYRLKRAKEEDTARSPGEVRCESPAALSQCSHVEIMSPSNDVWHVWDSVTPGSSPRMWCLGFYWWVSPTIMEQLQMISAAQTPTLLKVRLLRHGPKSPNRHST